MPAKRDLIEEFAHWFLFDKRRAQGTVDQYVGALRRLEAKKGPLEELSSEDLTGLKWELRRQPASWNKYLYAIQAFYPWWSERYGRPDPSVGLTRAEVRRPQRVVSPDLFERMARLPNPHRSFAQLIYLTGLGLSQILHLIESKARGPDFVVPGYGGKTGLEIHLEPDALDLLLELRRGAKAKRTFQGAFQRAGFTAQEVRAAARQDRGAPALRILVRFPQLAAVAAGLRSCRAQVETNPAKSIQDAATTLEELLERLGAKGNRLAPLLKDARKKGLLGHDEKLKEAIHLMGEWVAADRVTTGSGHAIRHGASDDAWLALRVVEALVIRLVKGF